ncbi:acyl-CoA thioesterase [Pseudonocardia halophobica]|uniref:acyl-CoA thioesterase n=1 Tax=Pseudonocardia halophobica TaxID=29401 RepID=UPI003D91EBCD
MTATESRRTQPTLRDLLELERIDRDLFRACTVFEEDYALFGGQVAAQALLAAGRTVADDRAPHSLHGYYLRGGHASRPTVFQVHRDRDGRSFTARRVVAIQDGEVIFNMAASFAVPQDGPDTSVDPVPEAPDPDTLSGAPVPRVFGFEGRTVHAHPGARSYPVRYWTRCTEPLPEDPLVHASALTYISDMFGAFPPVDGGVPGPSLDHAIWFHRPVRADEWMLIDLVPRSAAGGRNWYTGTLHDRTGRHVASLTQECLFRAPRS